MGFANFWAARPGECDLIHTGSHQLFRSFFGDWRRHIAQVNIDDGGKTILLFGIQFRSGDPIVANRIRVGSSLE